MTRYAVGDLQGCLQPLICLLEEVAFNRDTDQLWLVGDLINRGPDSLGCLRFVRDLGDCTRIVLGNHDLHFLAVAYGVMKAGRSDTFDEILQAPDRDDLVAWLRQQLLFYSDPSHDFHMGHAGLPPIWSIQQAHSFAREVEAVLQSSQIEGFLKAMYGNQPDRWQDELEGMERLRVITNYLTRMRFCNADSQLDLKAKLATIDRPGFAPWFQFPNQLPAGQQLVFGHWASIEGYTGIDSIHALETGCVWGREMTLMNLDSGELHQCSCDH